MPKYHIGVVIVSYNVMHFLMQTLKSIFASNIDGLELEVWVVDNNSVDKSVEMVRKFFPTVKIIVNDGNVGFSAANNQAIRQMDAQYVLLLNPDTVLNEDTLSLCKKYLDDHPEVGALGPRMIDGSGKFLPESKRQLPNVWNSFCKLSYLSDLFPKSKWFSGYNLGYLSEFNNAEIDVLCGAFMMMPNQVLARVGLLDEAFFMYGEDIDLSYRIQSAGYKITYYAETTIIHYKGESTKKSSLNYVKTFYGAMDIYVKKHYSSGASSVLSGLLSFAIFIRAFFAGLYHVGRNWVRPLLDGLMIYIGLMIIKSLWATYYFKIPDYYAGSYLKVFIILYTLMWIIGAYTSGWYHEQIAKRHVLKAILYPTLIILVVYGLLPEDLRTSRAILLFGSFWAMIVLFFNSFWLSKFYKSKPKNVAIVGSLDDVKKIKSTIIQSGQQVDQCYHVSTDHNADDFLQTIPLDQLGTMIKTLKIDEVIYVGNAMSTQDIIKSMTSIGTPVDFKIADEQLVNIVGSSSRNQQGEYYGVQISYSLSKPYVQTSKRCLDVLVAAIMVLISPILWPFLFLDSQFWRNIWAVLLGQKTWVGYGGDQQDWGFLPRIAPGVIKAPFKHNHNMMSDHFYLDGNIVYARHYQVWDDVSLIFRQMYKVVQK
jgi:GT2 family glycosyltransferase